MTTFRSILGQNIHHIVKLMTMSSFDYSSSQKATIIIWQRKKEKKRSSLVNKQLYYSSQKAELSFSPSIHHGTPGVLLLSENFFMQARLTHQPFEGMRIILDPSMSLFQVFNYKLQTPVHQNYHVFFSHKVEEPCLEKAGPCIYFPRKKEVLISICVYVM